MQHPSGINRIPWDQFESREMREASFDTYPLTAAKSKMELAVSGFVYTGDGVNDQVMCYFCRMVKENWDPAENIDDVHRPHCTGRSISVSAAIIVGSAESLESAESPSRSDISIDEHPANNQNHSHMEVSHYIPSPHTTTGPDIEHENNPVHSVDLPSSARISRQIDLEQTDLSLRVDSVPVMHDEQETSLPYNATESIPGHSDSVITGTNMHDACNADLQNSISTQHINITGHQGVGLSSSADFSRQCRNISNQNATPVPNNERTSHTIQTSFLSSHRQHPYSRPEQTARPEHGNPDHQTHLPPLSSPLRPPSVNSRPNTPSTATATPAVELTPTVSTSATAAAATSAEATPSISDMSDDERRQLIRDLGIFTEKPKHPEYASVDQRLHSYETENWKCTYPTKEDLAKAGLYYAGRADCGRCFFCGGGLRNWDPEDSPYVEHARWFSKCLYIRQYMGQEFVDAVQNVTPPESGTLTLKRVTEYMRQQGVSTSQLFGGRSSIEEDKAVQALLPLLDDTKKDLVIKAALQLRENGVSLSADVILEKVHAEASGATRLQSPGENNEATDELKNQNEELRHNFLCKICLIREVQMAFLPCGHLVACWECALALTTCPVCRSSIESRYRVYLS